ncbi:Uncharacterized protein FKW44_014808 [Caligus rogercresseyi]|uniref:Uncharacterized protein n=1 Tax=Caligus rogercresseyi TaxID=217165 RepID=A0A7T8GZD9_CALRO|nr:Uncharacterized protein FKW44_014808 [Caligus rogercresseyi]
MVNFIQCVSSSFHHSLHTGLNALTDLDTSAASKDMATDNDRWICREASEVPMVFRTKNPANVMPPHFFEPKQKVNQEVYLGSSKRGQALDRYCGLGRKYTFQQDSAPAHKAKTVQAWLKENTWPPTPQISTLVTTNCRGSWRGRPVRPTTTLWRPLSRPYVCGHVLGGCGGVQVSEGIGPVWRLWWKLEEDTLNKS